MTDKPLTKEGAKQALNYIASTHGDGIRGGRIVFLNMALEIISRIQPDNSEIIRKVGGLKSLFGSGVTGPGCGWSRQKHMDWLVKVSDGFDKVLSLLKGKEE